MYTTTCRKTAESIQWWLNVYDCQETLKDGYGMDIIIHKLDSSVKSEITGYDVMNGYEYETLIN
jgi:hypothetical protein